MNVLLWFVLALPPQEDAVRPEDTTFVFQGIGDLPGGEFHSEALGITDDGRIVFGKSHSASSEEEGCLWTLERGLQGLSLIHI